MTTFPLVSFGNLYAVPSRNGVSIPRGARDSGVKMINMGELFHYDRVGDTEMVRVPLTPNDLTHSLVETGDLLFARRSLQLSGAGRCSIVGPSKEQRTFESSIIRVRLNYSLAVPEFYFYFFKSPNGRQTMNTIVEQAVVAGIRASDLRNLYVPLPPIDEQREIAAELGAIDDKIESNWRTMVLLDELARTLFRHWRTEVSSSELSNFGSFSQVFGGATPRTSVPEYWDGNLCWLTPTDVTKLDAPYSFSSSRTITDAGLASCAAALHPAGTIFMTSRATIGAFAIGQVPSATNQGFIAVRPVNQFDLWFLFEEMRSRVEEFRDNANGSTFLELSRGRFKELPLEVPPEADRRLLFERLDPLHAKATQLTVENTHLEKLRDELLYQLLSGRIRISEVAS